MAAVAGVVLAAGAATRMGSAKQLAEIGGETMLGRALRTAGEAGLAPLLVVLGARAEEVRAGVAMGEATVLVNEGWAEGMASSVRVAAEAMRGMPEVRGAVMLLCDMPGVTAGHLRALVERGAGAGAVVASAYAGRRGVPAYFPAATFGALGQMRGDAGARSLLEGAVAVELAGGEMDVDTPEALEAARRWLRAERG